MPNIKLSKDKMEEIKTYLLQEIERADGYFESEIETKLIERHHLYESDLNYYKQKYPKLSNITTISASDCQDTIEWAMPSLLRIFFSTDEIIKLQGVREEFDKNAQSMSDLIQYQLQRHNSAFLVFYDWFKSALVDNLGILKCYWEREEEIENFEMVTDGSGLQALQGNPRVRITSQEELSPGVLKIEYEQITSVTKNQPKIESILPSEFRYDPRARNIDECDFVAHRKIVNADYLRRQVENGLYDKKAVEKVIAEGGNTSPRTTFEETMNPNAFSGRQAEPEEAKKEFVLYECYWETDIDDDNLLEDVIVTVVENNIVRVDENTMGRHPFFLLSPIRDPLRVWAKRGISDLVGELQDLNTALLKQIVYNIAVNSDKQAFVNIDMLLDVNEFIEGEKAVRVSGDPKQAVYWMPIEPLPPQVFSFLEIIQGMKEGRTGITRYNQGLQADSLNKTATGISAIMSASTQRLELIARMFAETGVKELFRHLIRMNQQYIDETTYVRITGAEKVIMPDDLTGEIDTVVNAGIAVGTKEAQSQNLMQMLTMYAQLIPAGIAGPEHAAYAFGKLVENMGYKDTSQFVYTPQQVIQNIQMQQEAAQQKGPETRLSENIQVKIEILPIPTQIKVLQQMGIPATLEDYIQDIALKAHQANFMGHVTGGTNGQGQGDKTSGGPSTGDEGGGGPGIPPGFLSGPPGPTSQPPQVMPAGGIGPDTGTPPGIG